MNDEHALLAAIHESPDDDTARLVYADWLEEHGNAARAEFIRVQCKRARLKPNTQEWKDLANRESDLLREHGHDWLPTGLNKKLPSVTVFSRGFPETRYLQNADAGTEADEKILRDLGRWMKKQQITNFFYRLRVIMLLMQLWILLSCWTLRQALPIR